MLHLASQMEPYTHGGGASERIRTAKDGEIDRLIEAKIEIDGER